MIMLRNTLLSLCFSLLTTISVIAQTVVKGRIDGVVTDSVQVPISFAFIKLIHIPDSTIRAVVSDEFGQFSFPNTLFGKYKVLGSMLGYKNSSSMILEINAEHSLLHTKIQLPHNTNVLKGVTVTGYKSILDRKSEGLVLNVENSSYSGVGSSLDLLQKIPSIIIDSDNKISIAGRNGVILLIDGKRASYTQSQLTSLLESTNSNVVKSIEVITNPSSKFDAEGNAGVINIVLKKDASLGYNGSITSGAGYGNFIKINNDLGLNYRNKKVNIFLNYGYNYNKFNQKLSVSRNQYFNNTFTNLTQDGIYTADRASNRIRLGSDFFVSKSTTIGTLLTTNLLNGYIVNQSESVIRESMPTTYNDLKANNKGPFKYSNFALNANMKSIIDSMGREIVIDFDYARFNSRDLVDYDSRYKLYTGSDYSSIFLRNTSLSKTQIGSVKLDYQAYFFKNIKTELGFKMSLVRTDNDFQFDTLSNDNWLNTNKSNLFLYNENINAVYVNLIRHYKKADFQIGFRAEQTNSEGNSVVNDQVVARNYIDFFPNISLNFNISKNHTIAVIANRRIDRPSYDDLNPFIYFVDKYTFNRGNPFLNPQYSTTAQFTYTYKSKYALSFGSTITQHPILRVLLIEQASNSFVQMKDNLSLQKNININLFLPLTVNKMWSCANNISIFHNEFSADKPAIMNLSSKKTAFQIASTNNFSLNKKISIDLTGKYLSPNTYGTYFIENSQFNIDFGLKANLISNKLIATFNILDVFNTLSTTTISTIPEMDYKFYKKNETRVARIAFSYYFGNKNVKAERKRSTGLKDELQRVSK